MTPAHALPGGAEAAELPLVPASSSLFNHEGPP